MDTLKLGDKVKKKVGGFPYWGTIVSLFTTQSGKERCVVDFFDQGMLHIYSLEQIELISEEKIFDYEKTKWEFHQLNNK